jgi:hypothetical protein
VVGGELFVVAELVAKVTGGRPAGEDEQLTTDHEQPTTDD